MRIIYLLMLPTLLLVGCAEQPTREATVVGFWKSLGGGWVLDIRPDSSYTEYDVTAVSCLEARTSDVEEFKERLFLADDTLRLRRGVIEYRFVRADSLPARCRQPLSAERAADPRYNFEIFAATVREHYAFMELNNVDWEALYAAQKARLAASPDDVTLYRVMEDVLAEINDNHGSVEASDAVYEALEGEDAPEETPEQPEIGDFQVAGAVAKHYLEKEMTEDSFILQWGTLAEGIGYIQVKAMFLLTDMGMPRALIDSLGWEEAWRQAYERMGEGAYIEMERQGMAEAMARAMADLSDTDKLVVDLRFNGGGQDLVSLELLRWFNERPRVFARQRLVHEGGRSPAWELVVPAAENAYTKPVYLLTSQQTGSAAEVAAMASMVLPHVRRVGEPTMGALSTALEKKLANGWDFAVSNEIYRAADGQVYENRGVPVDVPLNYPADRQTFFRSVLDDLPADKAAILEVVGG